MKALVLLLGLITATLLSGKGAAREEGRGSVAGTRSDCGVPSIQITGEEAVTVRIRAYKATGELDIVPKQRDAFTLGTRVLLTCDVTELPESSEVVRYRWFHNCKSAVNINCEIRDGDPYYRVVSDTLLVDVTSKDQGGRYYCTVHYLQEAKPQARTHITQNISVAGQCTHQKYYGNVY